MPAELGATAVITCPELVALVPEEIPPEPGAAAAIPWLEEVAVTLVGTTCVDVGVIACTTVKATTPADSIMPARAAASIRRRATGIPFISAPR